MNRDKLEVWLDADFISEMTCIGTLAQDRGNIRFRYAASWLGSPYKFDIDPDLSLDDSTFHPDPQTGNFGIFLDSSPDRWGQTLMQRREALEAKDENRPKRNLYAWDFLIGAQDLTRQGALRFKYEGSDSFLSDSKFSAPPLTALSELEAIAKELTSKRIDDLVALRKWLSVLVAPGASLGGARPKANFMEPDRSIWIAKFPAMDDDRDIGGWEGVVHYLAEQAGIDVPEARLARIGKDHHTFCLKRFDRSNGRRRFYASAMTLLKFAQSEGASYLDLAQFIMTSGASGHTKEDLAELFRRVVFNVAVGNRDDHLRNHGFVLTPHGWRLAPAFDINPNIDKADHVLNLDESDNRPSLDTVLSTAELYDLDKTEANQIVNEVIGVVNTWKDVARQKFRMPAADIELISSAFLNSDAPYTLGRCTTSW